MIYIDPPYNTGNEFIYPDKFSETLETYLSYAGLLDGEGKKFSTNTPNEGRFHTKWLNMMYPRLYLARNLLRKDGVIFISIDDNELYNLKMLCDVIFGPENFIANITREAIKGGSQSKNLRVNHDYILAYARNEDLVQFSGYEKEPIEFNFRDEKGPYAKGRELNKWGAGSRREDSPSLWFPIPGPNNEEVYPIRNDGSEGRWRLGKEKMLALVKNGDVIFEKRPNGTYIVYEKIREQKSTIKQFISIFKDKYINAKGTERVKELFNVERSYFDYVKPTELMYDLMVMAGVDENDIVMDFFAGSCATADSVLQYCKDFNKYVNFVMIQLPEPCEESSEAYKAGYKNIADIGKERIRRVFKKLEEEQATQKNDVQMKLPGTEDDQPQLDLGFKVFKLDRSNFRVWDGTDPEMPIEKLEEQLTLHADHINAEASQEDILYELLLKAGYPLTSIVEKMDMAGKTVYSIAEGALLICLEDEITRELIDAAAEAEPVQFICLDRGFKGNDQLKANAVQTFAARNQGRDKEKQIVFRTV